MYFSFRCFFSRRAGESALAMQSVEYATDRGGHAKGKLVINGDRGNLSGYQ